MAFLGFRRRSAVCLCLAGNRPIRAQLQTIESQSDTILRQNQFMVMMRMKDRRPARPRKPEIPWGLPNGWVN